ncbi:MAG TPA: helix-turn-helix domain-containing protein [Acidimicrobiales bacterium]|jgi:DNA-binding transcriptional ArsR family regulator
MTSERLPFRPRKVVELRPRPKQKLSDAEQDQLVADAPRVARNTVRELLSVTAGNDFLKARLYPDPADPTKLTLVERTGIPRRTLQRHLALLVDAGLVVCQLTGNRGRLPEYRFLRRAERETLVRKAPSSAPPAAWARIADPELRADALELWS